MTKTQVDVFQMREDRSLTEYSALLHSISESTDRLSHLVNDLLTQELLEPIFCGCKSHFLDKKYLEENRILTSRGKSTWSKRSIETILTNEKYVSDDRKWHLAVRLDAIFVL